ncbi:MAG: HAMP domain-containing sensor histidine kinase [Pseudomonadota bacterium]
MTATDTGRPGRGRATIFLRLVAALFALVLVVAALGGLTVFGMQRSMQEVRRAEQSLQQLENARAIEAAFNRYLVAEIGRHLTGGGDPREARPAAVLRGALLSYRQAIGVEIQSGTTEQERAAERAEMVRARALSDLFETVETEAMIMRLRGLEFDATASARLFLESVAAGRQDAFRSVIFEVLQDERQEAAAAFANLDALRARLVVGWSLLAAALVIAAALFGILLYRGLMRPIARLSRAVEGVGEPGAVRAPIDLPGEFAGLARGFNAMARRIETEQERLQTEVASRTADLAAANDALTQVDAARRQFFANVGHELRTPVTVLLGEAQLALRSTGEERAALQRIAASGGFLRRRIDDLMRLARSEDGALALQMGKADLAAAAEAAVEAAATYAAAQEIVLSLDDRPADPVPMVGDEEALRQAALALIDNGVKFSPPGGTVLVRVRANTEEAALEVSDSGPGFDAADPEALFDRYAQASSGRQAGGSGLGLAIVKWIAEQHGGRVEAANGKRGGAVVTLVFPR